MINFCYLMCICFCYIYAFVGCFLHMSSYTFSLHSVKLHIKYKVYQKKKKIRIWISNNSVDYYNFYSFLVLLSPYYLWYIFLTSTVWLQNMYMYGVGIDNHEEQIFQESSNVCKMIFFKNQIRILFITMFHPVLYYKTSLGCY